jgi:hypothetical protein
MELTHQTCERLIEQDFVRGGLTAAQSVALRRHLQGCEACGRLYARYAEAEAALYPRSSPAAMNPAQLDRVGGRLFGHSRRAPSHRWAWGGFGAVAAAAAASLVLTVSQPPTDGNELRSRQGETAIADAPVALRALRLRPGAQGLDVHDLATSGRLRPGDRVALVYAHRKGFTELRVRHRDPEGRAELVATLTSLPAGAVDERIAVLTVDERWSRGTHVFQARFDGGPGEPVVREIEVEVDPS